MTYLKQEEQAIFKLRQLYRQYGYCPYKMSRFEEYELYVQNKDFLLSDRIITFPGSGGKLLALKPDVTLSIIKHTRDLPGQVRKLYYNENVYRADRDGQSIKEIMQTGVECVGDLSRTDVAEVVLLAAESMAMLGSQFVLNVSHMGIIGAVLDSCGIAGALRAEAMRCLRQKNAHEMRLISADPRLALLTGGIAEPAALLDRLAPMLESPQEQAALQELRDLCAILEQAGFGNQIRVDFSVGNDMHYYSGVVFKGYLEGIPTGILSGGQYDLLLRKMGRRSSAIGFAVYLSLLERQDEPEDYDVDTLILHGPDADPAEVMAMARKFALEGTVLVAREKPEGRGWKTIVEV